ncbi:type II/IV secretion system protein [Candidatus Woesebacteria bacterium]|nr:type II/IV secretion system protein [Candidatus Woesebacteria bacterium]
MLLKDEEIKELLKGIGILDDTKIKLAEQFMKDAHTDFSDALLQLNYITDEKLGISIANHLKIPFVTLSKISIPEEVFHIVPEKIARRKNVIAFARDETGIKLAMADPGDKEIIDMVGHKTQSQVQPYLATERDILNTFYIFKKDLQKSFNVLLGDPKEKAKPAHDVSVSKIVDLILETAYYDKVSDIHIEPQEENALVRYRIDGILHDVVTYPKMLHERIMTRIKVLSRLRTDEHLSPQDGKMRIEIEGSFLDLRVSTIPIANGEKAVLRLLSTQNRSITLTDLGMSDADLEKVSHAYSKSYGMILSTGPTGSGKSTTIYAILKVLNTRTKNITTIEDPVEYRIEGVNQIQVNKKANLTFAGGLRSILRQDPNIILVGEIRDSETASIAVNAALTGHLVVSTLHTNDAATALPRLMDMKIEPFLVASTVNVIIAQRLVRKICEMCKAKVDIKYDDFTQSLPGELIKKHFGSKADIHIYKGAGCDICHGTGYTGRLAVFEVLEVTKTIRELILKKADSDVIMTQARKEGMLTMIDDGLQKVAQGRTTLEEILRVTKVEE